MLRLALGAALAALLALPAFAADPPLRIRIGWATMPGQTSPDRLGAEGCAVALAV